MHTEPLLSLSYAFVPENRLLPGSREGSRARLVKISSKNEASKKKAKTKALHVTQQKLMVEPNFPLASSHIKRGVEAVRNQPRPLL